ncbi:hypothetical protein [Pseudorhizobium pelagicum]|uniref:Uncharacterized protein n=1 Tax=Pseudorhizobium pelagicum TaxID=1509405 RepID=A0A922T7F3_9HYPH|nr:hypothetical protein [Pseudorhizobium pelagicum]KEQ05715.1 hypothetical protein GV67_03910 [Pseudorhizobium pelagicum]KEQ06395.1 hypothetical protein GV68_06905 [Pseudorhizobium pelagicum]
MIVTILSHLWGSAGRDEHDKLSDDVFNEAKKLSDFLGMIVRMIFVQAAGTLLILKSREAGGLEGLLLAVAAVTAVGLAGVFTWRIFGIVLLYFTKDVVIIGNTLVRRGLVLFFLLDSVAMGYAIIVVVINGVNVIRGG